MLRYAQSHIAHQWQSWDSLLLALFYLSVPQFSQEDQGSSSDPDYKVKLPVKVFENMGSDVVVCACNPRYLGVRDWDDHSLGLAPGKK
jgi:hypothetical protein